MTYQSPPPPAPGSMPGGVPLVPAGSTRLRGRRPLQIAVILFVLGIAAFVVGGVTASNSEKKVKDFQRIAIATDPNNVTPETITFSAAGGYVAYYEAPDVTSSITKIPEPVVQLLSPSGQEMTLTTPYGNRSDNKIKLLTYDYAGHHGVAVWQFHISETGKYQVVAGYTNAPSTARMAFGKSIAKGTGIGAVFIGAGILLVVAAIVLLIIGLVKRSRHKSELATASAAATYPPAYPPASGGYPPPGYQPPPPGYQPPPSGYQPPPPPGS